MQRIDRLATGSVWTGRDATSTVGDRGRAPWHNLVLAAGGIAAAMAAGLVSDQVPHSTAQAVVVAGTVSGFAFAGVFWLHRRPASLYGYCLLLLAAFSAVTALQYSSSPSLYTVGVLTRAPFLVVALYCLLAFPRGWISGRATQRLMWWGGGAVLVSVLSTELFTGAGPPMRGPAGCGSACPSVQIGSAPDALATLLQAFDRIAPSLVALAACGVLVGRFIAGTHAERRSLRWMATFAAAAAAMFAVRWFLSVTIGLPAADTESLRWANAIVWALLPWVMIASLVQAQLFARTALDELLAKLSTRPQAPAWEHDVGHALDDPGLRLAFWSPSDQSYHGVRGETIERVTGASPSWYAIERNGEPVAAILHDPALDAEPELLRAAAEATLLSIDTRHLEDDIQSARAAALATAEEERRRLERDLHDGAQQHLIALRIKLGLIMELGENPPAELLNELCDEVDAALDELRRLAQGVYPSLLRTDGLASALSAVARRSPVPAVVRTSGVGRYPPEIESAVYFCCLEALQNTAKHAGPGAAVNVRLADDDGVLRFAVDDTGMGFDSQLSGNGVGLANMTARVGAVGGTLHVVSAPGHGTSVSGRIELARGTDC